MATDDPRIADALSGLAEVKVAMTAATHASGTDRLAECARIAGWAGDTVVVNLQGDEPFAPAAGIRAVADALVAGNAPMSTLATTVEDAHTLFDPNVVKLVRNVRNEAMYFSRAPIAWHRDGFARSRDTLPEGHAWLRHIGIYGYRAGFLQFAAMPPGQLEQVESLEQLRVLEAGYPISVAISPEPFPPGIDTPEDLERAEALLQTRDEAAARLPGQHLPFADGRRALRARLDASPLAGRVQVDSAGTGDWHVGEPPDRRAIACAAGHGVDIGGLRARQLQAWISTVSTGSCVPTRPTCVMPGAWRRRPSVNGWRCPGPAGRGGQRSPIPIPAAAIISNRSGRWSMMLQNVQWHDCCMTPTPA